MTLPKTLPSLTSCRFIAALGVAIFHMSYKWPTFIFDPVAQVGWLGVPFFFILSGFVLMWSFDPLQSKKEFYVHRLSRIYPLHIMGLAVSLLSFHYYKDPLAGFVGSRLSIVANALLVHGWIPWHPSMRQSWNGVSWTLSCEFFFYLLSPFLFSKINSVNMRAWYEKLGLIWLLFFACSYYSARHNMAWQTDLLQCYPCANLVDFMLGAVAAKYIKENPHAKPVNFGLICWIFPIFAWRVIFSASDNPTLNLLSVPGFLLLIITLALKDVTQKKTFLWHPLFIFLGEASFALYMCHALILGAASGIFHHFGYVNDHFSTADLIIILISVICILASIILHKWVEIPARHFIIRIFIPKSRVKSVLSSLHNN